MLSRRTRPRWCTSRPWWSARDGQTWCAKPLDRGTAASVLTVGRPLLTSEPPEGGFRCGARPARLARRPRARACARCTLNSMSPNPTHVHTTAHPPPTPQVTIVKADMRTWDAPHKADILVSELLGSFGDNELSPECLDGAQRFLAPGGVSIPRAYTSFLAPITTAKLWVAGRGVRTARPLRERGVRGLRLRGCVLGSSRVCAALTHTHAPKHIHVQNVCPPLFPPATRRAAPTRTWSTLRPLMWSSCTGGREGSDTLACVRVCSTTKGCGSRARARGRAAPHSPERSSPP